MTLNPSGSIELLGFDPPHLPPTRPSPRPLAIHPQRILMVDSRQFPWHCPPPASSRHQSRDAAPANEPPVTGSRRRPHPGGKWPLRRCHRPFKSAAASIVQSEKSSAYLQRQTQTRRQLIINQSTPNTIIRSHSIVQSLTPPSIPPPSWLRLPPARPPGPTPPPPPIRGISMQIYANLCKSMQIYANLCK